MSLISFEINFYPSPTNLNISSVSQYFNEISVMFSGLIILKLCFTVTSIVSMLVILRKPAMLKLASTFTVTILLFSALFILYPISSDAVISVTIHILYGLYFQTFKIFENLISTIATFGIFIFFTQNSKYSSSMGFIILSFVKCFIYWIDTIYKSSWPIMTSTVEELKEMII